MACENAFHRHRFAWILAVPVMPVLSLPSWLSMVAMTLSVVPVSSRVTLRSIVVTVPSNSRLKYATGRTRTFTRRA